MEYGRIIVYVRQGVTRPRPDQDKSKTQVTSEQFTKNKCIGSTLNLVTDI